MKKFWFFMAWVLPVVLHASPNDGTIMLMNDTPFILTATVLASDGTFLGQFSIQPGQQKNFTQNLTNTQISNPGTPEVSLTPFTVIWQCPSETYYSMSNQVSPGALIRANDCPGNHFCAPKPEDKNTAPASTLKKKK
jgi:hypothetical protein